MLRSGLLSLALLTLSSAITCPDGSACEDGSACCLIGSGRYGCCPLAHPLPMVRPSSGSEGRDTACLDGSHCPSEYSCVKSHSSYQCCPLPQGVSCSDGKHCCPEHHRCGEDGHSCIKEKDLFGAVICPDEESECPVETTCCQLPDKSWGCCPMAKAVCCKDGEHCCPEGFTCDTLHSKCLSPTRGDAPMWAKLPARKRAAWEDQTALQPLRDATEVNDLPAVRETSVPCPDGHQCPDGCTCCQLRNGSFGCCPYPNAVCCSDHMHCCPSGATCDLEHSACVFAVSQTPMAKNIPASKDVICPDKAKCPENTTCCRMADRHYGCCSLPRAVCCEDHIHCCPEGTECDTAHSACLSPSGNTAWMTKLTVLKNEQGDVSCDSTHACPDGTTCCKTAEGGWACCPLPKAVCCDDHIHCCPEDTTCDTAAGTCNKAKGSVPWLEKIPPLTHHPNKAGDVSCDSTHACPDGTTCCKTAEGGWACCPLPKAVCCDDHVHCCPEDTTCNVPAGSCDEATVSVPWLEKMPPLTHHPNKAGNVPCDSTHACPDGTTCCKTEGGDWACCPLPKAVCCDDHIHCCPEDTTCDTAAGTCNKAKGSVPWLEKIPPLTHHPNKAGNVSCDSTHACPDGTTCCKTAEGGWACCPLPKAVCCDDHVHCCPEDTTCNVPAGSCDEATVSVPWLEKMPPLTHHPNKAGNVPCNSTHACPDGTTCCKTAEGDWACCPLPKAVCCEDHVHCCPEDTTCDTAAGTCNKAEGSVPWLENMPPLIHRPNKAGNVPCNSTHACPDGTTCCKTEGGDWACCPLPKAVCCDDHIHCCPEDTTCDTAAGTCNKAEGSVPWLEKMPPLTHHPNKAGNVSCDSTHACPDGTTCCKTAEGGWACCPLPKAVCCDDHVHCCPEDTTCNVPAGSCDEATVSIPWLEKMPPLTHHPNKAGNVSCDSTHTCPDGTTCCKTAEGGWACCPLPKAVCCDDHVHCCPEDTTCNVPAGSCDEATVSVPWLEKMPPLTHHPNKAGNVPCNSTHACPDGTTCCKTAEGGWACCPLPKAVCCDDHVHCCPEDTTCDTAAGTCNKAKGSVPWLENMPPLIHRPNKAGNVQCNSTHACPDGTTCCKTEGGDWACCPLPKAVCCDDHIHCCPEDTTCDTTAGTCNKAGGSVPWLENMPPLTHHPNKAWNVSCDSTHACPDGTTCCKTAEGGWACCPLPKAVCCDDHVHCCPEDTTCNVPAGSCDEATVSVPWLEKMPPLTHHPNKAGNVPCNSTHACPDGTTCCKTAEGGWACCPLPKAVCCDDHVHCCPEDTTCDTAAGTCNKAKGSVPWLENMPPLIHRPNKAGNVPCNSTHACPDGTTCCKTEGGDWACCPLPKAVCCDDHIHCCPEDTTCDTTAGTCNKAGGSVPWLENMPPLTHHPNKAWNVSCDSTHACPDGTTCCKTAEGGWACCPLPKAVCCDDHVHCCPEDTTCNVPAGSCDEATVSVPWLEKMPPLTHHPNKAGNVPCDSTHACPDGTTCCKTEGGDWACCPLPKAVCCDDHIHCCPEDTTCDTAAGTCNKAKGSVPWLEKMPALSRVFQGAKMRSPQLHRVACNATASCPDGTTCCLRQSVQQWGCCPLPTAVCCAGGEHCCPHGYTCDGQARCHKRLVTTPWSTQTGAAATPALSRDVQCDRRSRCAAGSTCCPLLPGQWGCCPLGKAVCCEDMKHCCPAGYTCGPPGGSCYRSGERRWDTWQGFFRKTRPLNQL